MGRYENFFCNFFFFIEKFRYLEIFQIEGNYSRRHRTRLKRINLFIRSVIMFSRSSVLFEGYFLQFLNCTFNATMVSDVTLILLNNKSSD